MVLFNSNTIKRLFQNNDLGDLGVNVIIRNGTVCLNINTKCRNDPIMLQSPPERDKYFFHRATILFTLPENLNCVYRFTHRISRTRGSKWSHINPAFGTWTCLWDEHISHCHTSDKHLHLPGMIRQVHLVFHVCAQQHHSGHTPLTRRLITITAFLYEFL